MPHIRNLLLAFVLLATTGSLQAEPIKGFKPREVSSEDMMKLSAGCAPARAAIDLDINNVRARIMNGGDMWWDLVNTPRYEVPKVTEAGEVRRNSMFAGALWLGGWENDNLRLAAMTYRQSGSDFFPGPLDTVTASISASECLTWDKIWEINRDEIDEFLLDRSLASEDIRSWPAHGNRSVGQANYLAPFVDVDGDFRYDAGAGDYPDITGDQALWYVYNDKGNIHNESQAQPIGIEIQTMAFAFSTNDELNNTTFYRSVIVNRSRNRLDSTFFGQWIDADLGYAYDDYVGVDTSLNLGICYNGDAFDETITGYGSNPPSVGVDFFQGPYADPNDGRDNNRDGIIDEANETIGMSYFVYYNNDFAINGNPEEPLDYYYYLTGSWKNGQAMCFGGNGYTTCTDRNQRARYMFPAEPREPDPAWSEVTAGNKPADRRFLQSAGPFSLLPGAKNQVVVGVVWARATTGGNLGSLDQLKLASREAENAYRNNFRLFDGPIVPPHNIQELDQKLILSLENTKLTETFRASVADDVEDSITYVFEGYQIYQVRDANVTAGDLQNADRARLIAQVDISNGVTQLVNRIYDTRMGQYVPVLMADGSDLGLQHTFEITRDVFASGDDRLVNYQFYYYMVVPYTRYTNGNPLLQYRPSRRGLEVVRGVPHKPDSRFGGSELSSDYGDGPQMIRIEGTGNGGNILNFTEATEQEILNNVQVANPQYERGDGPVSIRVYDPTKVVPGNFEFRIIDPVTAAKPGDTATVLRTATWSLKNLTTGETVVADTTIGINNEQVIPKWGLAVSVKQALGLGNPKIDTENGLLSSSITFGEQTNVWIRGLTDSDPTNQYTYAPNNWIRAGKTGKVGDKTNCDPTFNNDIAINDAAYNWDREFCDYEHVDPNEKYEDLVGSLIAPAAVVARAGTVRDRGWQTFGPIPSDVTYESTSMKNLNSIDLVLTPNKDKWSRCMVIETGEDSVLNEGFASQFRLRRHASWDSKQADANGNPEYSSASQGMSWFPGYAVNLETGERLNVFFGEDSRLSGQNGADMLWNPTSQVYSNSYAFGEFEGYWAGGKHWVYVMNSRSKFLLPGVPENLSTAYDGCQNYADLLRQRFPSNNNLRYMWSHLIWVMEPLLATGYSYKPISQGMIPTETRISVRVAKPYERQNVGQQQNNGLPMYSFNTDDLVIKTSTDLGKDAIKRVNIVPNPYYAYSSYENSQVDNRVRIINLPKKCEISIYTLNGSLVRRFKKDESDDAHDPWLDWDLKNQNGVPIASGVYIIYVDGYELGSKVLKWFGAMRQVDLDSF